MSVIIGILLNTLIIAGMIVWLARGNGAAWINTLNATSLSTVVGLFVVLETAGAVLGMFIWATVSHTESHLAETLGYLGIWFGFVGTHILVNSATNIGKRLTDGTYTEKKGEAKAKIEAAKSATPMVATGDVQSMTVEGRPVTGERPAILTTERPAVRPTGDARVDDERGEL